MNIAVRYHSRSGKTKIVADAVAGAASVTAEDCTVPVESETDLLFIGGAVYWGGPDKKLKVFISDLDAGLVKNVAVFGLGAITKTAAKDIYDLLAENGFSPVNDGFSCAGGMLMMKKGHPNDSDTADAEAWTKLTIDSLS